MRHDSFNPGITRKKELVQFKHGQPILKAIAQIHTLNIYFYGLPTSGKFFRYILRPKIKISTQ